MRFFVSMVLFAAAGALAAAEVQTTVEAMGLITVTRDAAGDPVFGLIGKGDLLLTAVGNPNVKAVSELFGVWSGSLAVNPADIVKRLYVKVDFGGFEAMLGKARVSWGEGQVFNAGDVVFGSLDPLVDLTRPVLRDETDWLADIAVYLGPFTYIEGIFLPYSPLSTTNFPFTDIYHLRGGGRFVAEWEGLKIETGYLFKADEAVHHPYLSLHGSLFFDFAFSASIKIPAADYTADALQRGCAFSAGLRRIFQIGGSAFISIGLETAIRPFGLWEKPAAPSPNDLYGLLLYPEISYSPGSDFSVQLRAMINPLSGAGLASAGISFGMYQGFSLIGFLWSMWGDGGDAVYGFGRQGDIGISIGFDFIY